MEQADFSSTSFKRSPRAKRATKSKRISQLSKEQLSLAIQKKRECNGKAQKIVEELIEQHVDRNALLEKINDINQSHYEDVTEERSISKFCGYPLCDEILKDIPSKQYHISRSSNKVYDITERKKFCSNMCFRASNYLKEQLLTSPLWLRDQEVIPLVKLLPHRAENQDTSKEVIAKLSSLTLESNGEEDLKKS